MDIIRPTGILLFATLVGCAGGGDGERSDRVGAEAPEAASGLPDTLAMDTSAALDVDTRLPGAGADTVGPAMETAGGGMGAVPRPTGRDSLPRDGGPPTAGDPDRGPGATTPPQPNAPADANDILARAERVYDQIRSMEADFVQQIYVPLLDDTRDSRGKLYHRAPDRFLMRFSEPAGDIIVADGTYGWMYYPSTDPKQVMRTRLTAGGQQVDLQREFLSDATERFEATRTGTETVGGRSTHALTLLPRGQSPYRRIRIWVDAEDFLVRRFEITEQNESVRRLEMSNISLDRPLSDDLFRFTPPAGAEIYEP